MVEKKPPKKESSKERKSHKEGPEGISDVYYITIKGKRLENKDVINAITNVIRYNRKKIRRKRNKIMFSSGNLVENSTMNYILGSEHALNDIEKALYYPEYWANPK